MSDTTVESRPNDAAAPNVPRRHGLLKRLYHGETNYDFVGRRRVGFAISGLLLLLSFGSLAIRHLNLGLDFKGGVVWEVPAAKGITTSDVSSILDANGIKGADAKIQTLNGATGRKIRVQVGVQPTDVAGKVRSALAQKAGFDPATQLDEVPIRSVTATWGSTITKKALTALAIFFVALTAYIALRFEWKMAIGAFVAVAHDVAISVGIYSILQFQVTPATVIAFLTILGYSLYDTIVVFDKVHDNSRRLTSGKVTYSDVVNLSMNQTLMRSINTSLAAVLPVASLLVVGAGIMGAVALEDFALALFIGLIAGSYSSIFIASPLLAMLKEREPKYKAIASRLGRVTGDVASVRSGSSVPAAHSTSSAGPARPADLATVASRAAAGLTHPPRPRKKKRR